MGHIVFAAPDIRRFHLHERLRRELIRRGHRVSILCTERDRATFWQAQASDAALLSPDRRTAAASDAELTATLEGMGMRERRRAAQRTLGAARRWLERERPDLLLFGGERSPAHAALQFAARTVGCAVLWVGDGLLPHTMQVDARGVDGDASCRRWRPADYRVVTPDEAFLQASLAHALAMAEPTSLPRADIHVPLASRRLLDAGAYALQGRLRRCWRALAGWQQALPQPTLGAATPLEVSARPPYVAVLLQAARDPRLQFDAGVAPTPEQLLRAARRAADAVGAGLVAVLPPGRSGRRMRALARRVPGTDVLESRLGPVVAATAAAVVTVNHPLAAVALLAGTPVVNTGRALSDLPGVTTTATRAAVPAAGPAACRRGRPALRRRFLTWQLRYGHLWCSPSSPNHNGVLGLAQAVERSLERGADTPDERPRYRPGPTWPLARS